MMKPASRSLLNRLLSGTDGLAAVDKEEILATVLKQAADSPVRWWRMPSLRWGFAALATSLIVLVAVQTYRPDEFTARGGPAPDLDLACAGGACRAGSQLLFKLTPGHARYFSALAIAPDQRVLWYFDALALSTLPEGGVPAQAPVLGPEHGPGPFEIVAVFSRALLTRSQIRTLLEAPADKDAWGATVLRRKLVIEP